MDSEARGLIPEVLWSPSGAPLEPPGTGPVSPDTAEMETVFFNLSVALRSSGSVAVNRQHQPISGLAF